MYREGNQNKSKIPLDLQHSWAPGYACFQPEGKVQLYCKTLKQVFHGSSWPNALKEKRNMQSIFVHENQDFA